ncbi:MAG: hypothetical protein NTX53_17105 [candidate division WOR-3 bacterium]|nr:hypothetical protein [candidate division WOR-3 bacterium]
MRWSRLTLMLVAGALYAQATVPLSLDVNIRSERALSGVAGEYITLEAEVVNVGTQPISNVTTYLSLVDVGARMPVDLEDWSAEKGLFIGTIAAGETLPLVWKVHLIRSGDYTASVVAEAEGVDLPVISRLTYLKALPKRNLNPGNVLPVALGEPILLVFGFLLLRFWRTRKSQPDRDDAIS